jgi:stage II sporulation protein AA (anti-sigma F factor antagonist)
VKIDAQAHGATTVLTPHGPLAADAVPLFRKQLQDAIEQRQGRVVLDLRDVPYLDSGGIETLLEACGERRAVTARPRLTHLNDTCREALHLTDVLGRLEVFDTVENAIRSYKR